MLEKHLDLVSSVAPVTLERDVRQPAIACCLVHPGERDRQDLGDLSRGKKPILGHLSTTSLPQATQPGRGIPRGWKLSRLDPPRS
jgi:hypothetical protein